MDNKGFTLVELLVTIIVLTLIMSIGTYSITQVMKNAKKKDYELLITNIKSGVELYYQECKYAYSGLITCPQAVSSGGIDYYNVLLGDLVKYGFLKGNSTNSSGGYALVNPNDNENIENCKIKYSYKDGKVSVIAVDATGSCPTGY